MKILMSSLLNLEEDMNGVVVSAADHKNILQLNNHETHMITPYTYRTTSILFRLMKKSSQFFKETGKYIFSTMNLILKAGLLYLQVFKKVKNYDYFHAHDLISAAVFLLAVPRKKIIVLQAHFVENPWDEFVSGGYVKSAGLTYKVMKYVFSRTLLHRRLMLMPVSKRNQKLLYKIGPDLHKKSILFYPGLLKPVDEEGFVGNLTYLINVGTIDKRKNQIMLIELLAEIEKIGFKIPLLLVGPENEQEKKRIMERIKFLNITSDVIFMGQQTIAETRNLISKAALYIHTSKQESFGRTIIEAINHRTPAVAVEFDAVNEILDNQAVLNRDWSKKKMAEYILILLADKERRLELQSTQHQNFIKKFTADKMLNIYCNSLEEKWSIA